MTAHHDSSIILYKRLMGHVKPYWKQFVIGIIAMIILGATETAIPALLKPLLDGSFVEKDPVFMFWMPFILIAVFLVRATSNFVSTLALTWIGTKVILDLRQKMFAKMLLLPTSFYDSHATGNLVSKITYDVTQVTDAATATLTVLVRDTIIIIGLIGWMLYLNWILSLTTFAIFPFIILIVRFTGKHMRTLSRSLQAGFGDMTHVLEESIKGHKIVKIFAGHEYESRRFFDVANWVRRFQMKIRVYSMGNATLVEGLGFLAFAAIIFIGTGQAASGELTVGGFVSFFTAMGLLISPIKRITSLNETFQKGLAASESIFALIDETPEQDTGTHEIHGFKDSITFEKVSKHFDGADTPAVDEVSLTIKPGQTIALVGASGSGKTTLASLLPRFYQLTSGDIRFDNISINDISLKSLRQQLSFVSQDVVLFNDTVRANIAYGLKPPPSDEEIRLAADAAFVTEFVDQMPKGFDTMIGENGVRLSGGQRQRLAIARAFIKKAPLLILDEATSALDNESEHHVQQALEKLESASTTLVIAHRLSTVEKADRIFVMQQGRIIEQGTHAELLSKQGLYEKLYNNQFN